MTFVVDRSGDLNTDPYVIVERGYGVIGPGFHTRLEAGEALRAARREALRVTSHGYMQDPARRDRVWIMHNGTRLDVTLPYGFNALTRTRALMDAVIRHILDPEGLT